MEQAHQIQEREAGVPCLSIRVGAFQGEMLNLHCVMWPSGSRNQRGTRPEMTSPEQQMAGGLLAPSDLLY